MCIRDRIWPIDKLIPYARNARTHTDEQVAQVAASIIEFGWTNPILIGADCVVIAGHARLAAARRLRMEEVPVIVLDHLSETQRRALILADNRLAMSAGWDEDMLRVELESLKEDAFNLDLVGFTDEEAVSYTHLDVYKRQVNVMSASPPARTFSMSAICVASPQSNRCWSRTHTSPRTVTMASVSYTHLDVYKRQPARRPPK